MDSIINNMNFAQLESLWKATFTDYSIDDYIDTLDYDTEEEIVDDIKELLKEEINHREEERRKENEKFIESLMGMEEQPLIQQPRQKKEIPRRDIEPEKFAELIGKQFEKRQKRIEELKDVYDELYPGDRFVEGGDETFFEWLRNKDAPANDEKINEFIDSIEINSVIDLQKLNRDERDKAFDRMKQKLEELLGDLAITDKFLIHYRINGQWKTRTLTTEIYKQLMDSLDKKEFIYGKEAFESSYIHFSDSPEEGLFKLVYFDAISITPVKESGNTRKDNRSSFFPYLNKSDIDLSRYQIFDTIVKKNKKGEEKQRKELNDSCFVYALKQYGICEDILNKIRMRIHTRKFGLSKMDAICEEFKLHVIVHDLEDENHNSKFRVNKKNYFGVPEKDALNVIHLNSFKEHYFLEEKTKYSSNYIDHKYVLHEEVDSNNYCKRFKNGRWVTDNHPTRFISSGNLVKLLFENNYVDDAGNKVPYFEPMTYSNSKVLETTLYMRGSCQIQDVFHYNRR